MKQPLFSSAVCLTNLNPGDVLLMCSKVEQDVSVEVNSCKIKKSAFFAQYLLSRLSSKNVCYRANFTNLFCCARRQLFVYVVTKNMIL